MASRARLYLDYLGPDATALQVIAAKRAASLEWLIAAMENRLADGLDEPMLRAWVNAEIALRSALTQLGLHQAEPRKPRSVLEALQDLGSEEAAA